MFPFFMFVFVCGVCCNLFVCAYGLCSGLLAPSFISFACVFVCVSCCSGWYFRVCMVGEEIEQLYIECNIVYLLVYINLRDGFCWVCYVCLCGEQSGSILSCYVLPMFLRFCVCVFLVEGRIAAARDLDGTTVFRD